MSKNDNLKRCKNKLQWMFKEGRENMREHVSMEEGIRESFVIEMAFELILE